MKKLAIAVTGALALAGIGAGISSAVDPAITISASMSPTKHGTKKKPKVTKLVVASLTTSFVTFGFFFVPCFVGDIDAEIVIAGSTAELMPAPIPASARAPVTAMASFFISPPEKRWNGGGDQYLR